MIRFLINERGVVNRSRKVGPVVWPHFDLFFVHRGAVALRLESKPIKLSAGDGVLIYPYTTFTGESVRGTALASVLHFALDGPVNELPMPLRRLAGRTHGFEFRRRRPADHVERDLERGLLLATHRSRPLIHEMRVALLTLILAEWDVSRPQRRGPVRHSAVFDPLVQWLGANLHRPVSLREMAARARYSPSHFRSLFQEYVGLSPGKYLALLRINESQRLLREGLMPIKEIARVTGFADLQHFYRVFKSRCHTTPRAFRERGNNKRHFTANERE